MIIFNRFDAKLQMKYFPCLFCCVIFIWGCKQPAPLPANILAQKQMKVVLVDLHLADGYLNTLAPGDSINFEAAARYNHIFKKHKTDYKQFQRSYKYYSARPEAFNELYIQVQDSMLKLQKIVQKQVDKEAKDLEKKLKVK